MSEPIYTQGSFFVEHQLTSSADLTETVRNSSADLRKSQLTKKPYTAVDQDTTTPNTAPQDEKSELTTLMEKHEERLWPNPKTRQNTTARIRRFDEFGNHNQLKVSDITVLHAHINQNYGVATLHSSMPLSMKDLAEVHVQYSSLLASLKDELTTYDFESNDINRKGEMEGEVVGGNLSVLYSILGSESDIDTDGKILFLEDLDEYLYHIDRMMMNLKRNGKLSNLKGLIVGGMSDMNDNAIPFGKSAVEIIREAVEEYDYPVCFNFPAGHIEDNRALILGKKAAIRVTDNGCQFQYIS